MYKVRALLPPPPGLDLAVAVLVIAGVAKANANVQTTDAAMSVLPVEKLGTARSGNDAPRTRPLDLNTPRLTRSLRKRSRDLHIHRV